jgi:oligosaccharyltransferase complex subunit alpha (ribophorin I)
MIKNVGGESVKTFYYAVPHELKSKLVNLKIRQNRQKLPVTSVDNLQALAKYNCTLFEVTLQNPLPSGSSITLDIREKYYGRFIPFPAEITLTETQFVAFHDSKYLLSPYKVTEQTTKYKVKNVLSYTETDGISKKSNVVHAGPFKNVAPFSNS